MSRILKSMTYRLLHNKVFWLIMILLVIAEIGIFFYGGSSTVNSRIFSNHHTFEREDHDSGVLEKYYVEYEKEDPLLVSKYTQGIMMGTYPFVPGKTYEYEPSLTNVALVSILLSQVLMALFAADAIVVMVFAGDFFPDDAIRNMVTIKIRKEKIYLSAVIINAVVCIAMFITIFGILAICTLIAGYYPIIYAPSFISSVLTGLLVIIALSSMLIFILFMVQNSLLTFIFSALLVVLSVMNFLLGFTGPAFATKYNIDEAQMEAFFKGGFKIEGNGEWYLPVDRFQIGRVYYPEDDITIDFMSDELNEYYPGDAAIEVIHAVYRVDLIHYPFEMMLFYIYPMYRDGLIARYAVVSGCYLVLLLTGGCYLIRKRNVN